jgi:hypothetical protein
MGYKILSSTASSDSAIKIRNALEKLLGMEPKTILVSKDSTQCRGHKVIMRYGCGYGHANPEPLWNSKYFVNLCIDKLEFVRKFRDFVRVPEFHSLPNNMEFPVMIRETLTSAKSQGCHVVHNTVEFMQIWRPGYYWTKFYDDKEFELRVLVVLHEKGYELRIYKKVPVGQEMTHPEDFVVEGDNTEWKLKNPRDYPKVIKIVEKMAKTIWLSGGRFAGVDMIYVPSLKDYVILELNSGPWLTIPAAEWLATVFVDTQWKIVK